MSDNTRGLFLLVGRSRDLCLRASPPTVKSVSYHRMIKTIYGQFGELRTPSFGTLALIDTDSGNTLVAIVRLRTCISMISIASFGSGRKLDSVGRVVNDREIYTRVEFAVLGTTIQERGVTPVCVRAGIYCIRAARGQRARLKGRKSEMHSR